MNIKQLIRQIAFEGDIPQTKIAKKVGCSQVTISNIKCGRQFPDTSLLLRIIKLARSYNIAVELEELLTLKDEPNERSRKVRKHEA